MNAHGQRLLPSRNLVRDPADSGVFCFVHIPKTAGTSFRLALERVPSFNILYDYGENSARSTPALLEQISGGHCSLDVIAGIGKTNVIFGHMFFRKYSQHVLAQNVLSVLRNPLERLVSEYQHLIRNGNYEGSFPEFITSPFEMNKQSRMLKGVDIDAGGVFGLASHHGEYMELVRRRFNVPLDALQCNQAPNEDVHKRYDVSPDDIELAFELNDKEMVLVRKVASVFARALREIGINTTPPTSARFDCDINHQQFEGWVARRRGDSYFIEITVNDQVRAIVSLDRRCPDVAAKGLTEDERCGFSYPLALLGVRDYDRVGMRVLGARQLQKSVVYRAKAEGPGHHRTRFFSFLCSRNHA